MASIRRLPDGRLRVGISIADPLGVLLVPLGCVPALGAIIGLSVLSALVQGRTGLATALPILALGLPMLLVGGWVCLSFSRQTWEFDPRTQVIQVKRGPIPVRNESMRGLSHVRVVRCSDDDGGSYKALFAYADGREVAVNRVNTGSSGELEAFAEAVNSFLPRPN